MLNLSYSRSSYLIKSLKEIEKLRADILLFPLSPRDELLMRWSSQTKRIYGILNLSGGEVSYDEVEKTLASPPKRPDKLERLILGLKAKFGFIRENWLANPKAVNYRDIHLIYQAASIGKERFSGRPGAEKELGRFLDWLQIKQEHPVIVSAIPRSLARNFSADTHLPHILSYLFLYKNGYDLRGFLSLEHFWTKDLLTFKEKAQKAVSSATLTGWIEYFSESLELHLSEVFQNLQKLKMQTLLPKSFWKLTDRQKKILALLENPEGKLTNKKVQKNFKVSQITASRDLSKLASLGLLFVYGRGRSTYYTKA